MTSAQPESDSALRSDTLGNGSASTESDCVAAALELQLILKEEADILKRFASNELLRLLPRKEFSIGELQRQLNVLKGADGTHAKLSDPLKNLLREIDAMNRSNRLFIERSLSHWQDLISVFSPPSYGPNLDGTKSAQPPARGLTFCREI